jgi:predicted membrane channel-forming protein YqfA (hemolysin III family)
VLSRYFVNNGITEQANLGFRLDLLPIRRRRMYPQFMLYKRQYNYPRGSMWSAVVSALFASFFAGIYLVIFLDKWHRGSNDSLSTIFNATLFVLWLIAAIAHYFVAKSRAKRTGSPKTIDSYSIVPR